MQFNSYAFARASQGDWLSITELSPIARLVAELVDKTKRRFKECWLTNERISRILGVSVRSVQRALSELSLKGFISVVTNYGLRARRAIQLLWRSVPAPAPLPIVEVSSAPDNAPAPVAEQPSPAPDPVEQPQPERTREKATPKARATDARQATDIERELIHKAEAKFGPCFTVPVLSAIDNYGLLWTAQAIDETPNGKPWVWLLGKLRGWTKYGEVQQNWGIDYDALMAANRADIEAHWGPIA